MYINIGNFSHRKGNDLFIEVALRCLKQNPDMMFYWVGKNTPSPSSVQEILEDGLEQNFIFTETDEVPFDLLRRSSGLLFTGRSDCYPKVVSEAYAMSRSVFCFEGTGGTYQAGEIGHIYKRFDTERMAADVLAHAEKPREDRINQAGFDRFTKVLSAHVFAQNFAAFIRDPE
jgi:glycosyltransferase involved in cell wall biosynthesis